MNLYSVSKSPIDLFAILICKLRVYSRILLCLNIANKKNKRYFDFVIHLHDCTTSNILIRSVFIQII